MTSGSNAPENPAPSAPWLSAGDPDRVHVIAEAGVNHNGSAEMAHKLIDLAVESGADAVKFQTFDVDQLVSSTTRKAEYQESNTKEGGSQAEMLRSLVLEPADLAKLKAHADDRGIILISTPFDFDSADLLQRIGVRYFKLSSGDLNYGRLLRHVARKGLPIIISSGMATLSDVENAVETIGTISSSPLGLLHCVSNYPAPPHAANLRAIETLRSAFPHVTVGWSDHTTGSVTTIAAIALGARIIEKHVTLDCDLPGPDHKASLDPKAFKDFVEAIRDTSAALGDGRKRPHACEADVRKVATRRLVYARDIQAGAVLTEEDLIAIRQEDGLAPGHEDLFIGARLGVSVQRFATVSPADIQWPANGSLK